MTATGSAPVTTKSTQAADYPVATDSFAPLMANSSTSYFESSNISRAETFARQFQLTRVFVPSSGALAPSGILPLTAVYC